MVSMARLEAPQCQDRCRTLDTLFL
jgi:hypothetical protein